MKKEKRKRGDIKEKRKQGEDMARQERKKVHTVRGVTIFFFFGGGTLVFIPKYRLLLQNLVQVSDCSPDRWNTM